VERLLTLGIEATHFPLIEIEYEPISATALAEAAAIVATSRNALRALAASPPALSAACAKTIYVVGPGTADLAESLGFSDIIEGPGTASALAPMVAAAVKRDPRPVAVLTGDVSAFDFPDALENASIKALCIPAYKSVAATSLSTEVLQRLRSRSIDAVLLMSPRTAKIWWHLVNCRDERPDVSSLVHICASAKVAQVLPSQIGNIAIAEAPNLDEILALTKRLAAKSGSG
jgi:uroporphyrinogen-III synthase